jgi:uncharacterized protein (TIGR03435 family)
MNAIRILSAQPWVGRLGWTLVHFLWQGLAIAAVYAGARAGAKRSAPQRRYLLACAALAAMLAAPIATHILNGSPEPAPAPPHAASAIPNFDSGTTFAVTAGENAFISATVAALWSERFLPSVVMLWFTGTLVFWVRLTGGWMAASRLRTRLARKAPGEWQQALDRLRARLRVGRPVRLLVSGLVEAPVVIGWLRPMVLVPIGALAGLPAEHLEALLLHELAHIRRHDYLVNALQSIAEALLFYHPAVWWISGHIRDERERCCDDLAVAATGDAFSYATALADLEAWRPAHARSAVAANGGRLADRIARLLGQTRPETRTFSAPGAAGAVLLAIATSVLSGQSADRPKFEVASVKPTPDKVLNYAGMSTPPGGRLHAKNVTVSGMIAAAYHLQDFQIAGGPAWIHDAGFDIEAKSEANASRAQILMMLQPLLEDRFQLKFHRETRELPVYSLTVARGGAKLPAPQEGGCVKPGGLPSPGGTVPIRCGALNIMGAPSGMRARGGDVPMPELIRTLSMVLGRPVLDGTGVTTHFDVDLTFTPDDTAMGLMMSSGSVAGHRETMAAAAGSPDDPKAAPNILLAVQEQLGLKLNSTKGPAEVMVIDRVEKPSAN